MASVLGELGALWLLLSIVVVFAFGIMWPLMAFSITRNIKHIRVQLERLNDTLDASRGGGGGGVLRI